MKSILIIIKDCFLHSFNPSGRLSRKAYWLWMLSVCLIALLMYGVGKLAHCRYDVVLVSALLLFPPTVSAAVRRLHDVNAIGWLVMIPVVRFILHLLPSAESVKPEYERRLWWEYVVLAVADLQVVAVVAGVLLVKAYLQLQPCYPPGEYPTDYEVALTDNAYEACSDSCYIFDSDRYVKLPEDTLIQPTHRRSSDLIPSIIGIPFRYDDLDPLLCDTVLCDDLLQALDNLPEDAYLDDMKPEQVRKLIGRKHLPVSDRELLGIRRVRSIQVNDLGIFVYPFFDCRFTKQDGSVYFRKTAGSQRKNGTLYRKDATTLYFLGAWSICEDPTVEYGLDHSDRSLVGAMYKTGPSSYIMLFEGEIYEFRK